MVSLSTHVLDTSTGQPIADLPVILTCPEGNEVARAVTDHDGRITHFADSLSPGAYTLRFMTSSYFETTQRDYFYPHVSIECQLSENTHYHVPLLVSPFSFSTYRGS